EHFDDPPDPVQAAERGPGRREQVQRDAAGGLVALLGRVLPADLAAPGLAAPVGSVAREEQQVAGQHRWDERAVTRRHLAQLDARLLELRFGGHGGSLRRLILLTPGSGRRYDSRVLTTQ